MSFSYLDSENRKSCGVFFNLKLKPGRAAFAIPHDTNLSNGNMYRATDSDGNRITEEYANLRARYEPVSEILRVTGSPETHPLLSSLDDFANFELTVLPMGRTIVWI